MKNKRYILISLCILIGVILLLCSGCASKTVVGKAYENKIPKTPEQAGIKILDSTSCEGCHLDPEVISSFEKPKEAAAGGGETEGG